MVGGFWATLYGGMARGVRQQRGREGWGSDLGGEKGLEVTPCAVEGVRGSHIDLEWGGRVSYARMDGLGSNHVRVGAGIREMWGMRGGASASV